MPVCGCSHHNLWFRPDLPPPACAAANKQTFLIHDEHGLVGPTGKGKALLIPPGGVCKVVVELVLRPESVGIQSHWLVATAAHAVPAAPIFATGLRVIATLIPDRLRATLSRRVAGGGCGKACHMGVHPGGPSATQ